MNLKKSLKSQGARWNRKGQSTLEYFIIFAAVTSFSVAALGGFVSRAKTNQNNFFQKAAGGITQSGLESGALSTQTITVNIWGTDHTFTYDTAP